ncbi:nickel-dependent lactate racemase [Planctomycetota bacterium]
MTGKETDIAISYGRQGTILHTANIEAEWHIIRPAHTPPLPDPHTEFTTACTSPFGSSPLHELAQGKKDIVIVTSDGTRPVPNRELIPWIIEELGVSPDTVTVLLGTGSHRPNTDTEIEEIFGPETAQAVSIINHDAYDPDKNSKAGTLPDGTEVLLNKAYMEADLRIAVGFIEPHFFAGFSGGAKAVVPGIASIESIFHVHSAPLIADRKSTWGLIQENPLRQEIETMVDLAPPDFLVNVILNGKQEITGVFSGDYREAHAEGYKRVKEYAMAPVENPFPLVITSNSGYPLDQNLYQTVKGISAASLITEQGGTIIAVSECSDGIPDHGNFAQLMQKGDSAQDILDYIFALEEPVLDQWQAQVLCDILTHCSVQVYSGMDQASIEMCKLGYIENLQKTVEEHISSLGPKPRVAVLPDGPLTIPYVKEE